MSHAEIDPIPGGRFRLAPASYGLRGVARGIPGLTMVAGKGGAIEGHRDGLALLLAKVAAKGGELDRAIPHAYTSDLGLHAYQGKGVDFLAAMAEEGVILADDLGLGKSCQSLVAALVVGAQKVVIICPNCVRGVWERAEIAKWHGGLMPVYKTAGKTAKVIPPETRCVVVHFEILANWEGAIKRWIAAGGACFGIIDEIHQLQNPEAARSKAAREVMAACRWRVGLTATPMTGRPKDLYNPVDTVSPGRLGKPWSFYRRYCDAKEVQVSEQKLVWDINGISHAEELRARLDYFMLRRTKEEVALELPAFTRQVVSVPAPAGRTCDFATLLRSKTALRDALNAAAPVKFDQVVDLGVSHAEAGHNVVVFCHLRETAKRLVERFHRESQDVVMITGDTPAAQRHDIVAAEHQIIVATIDSMGVGISLAFADVCIFAELDYVPAKLLQAEGRLHRQGQRRNVLCQYVIAEGTADELVAAAVIGKLENMQAVVGEEGGGLAGDLRGDEDAALAELGKALEGWTG